MSTAGQAIDPMEARAAQLGDTSDPMQMRAAGQLSATRHQTPQANDNKGTGWSYLENLNTGLYTVPQHLAEYGAMALDKLGLTNNAYGGTKQAFDFYNKAAAPDQTSKAARTGQIVGSVIGTAPLAAATPFAGAGVLPAVGNAATQGLLSTASTADTDQPLAPQLGVGTLVGAGLGGATNLAGKALAPVLTPAMKAAVRIGKALRGDFGQAVSDLTGSAKPLTLMDVGGDNSPTARLARGLVSAPGDQSKELTQFLQERNLDQADRVTQDIQTHLADGKSLTDLQANLEKAQKAAATPLYQAAGIPQDTTNLRKLVGTNAAPVLNTPEIKTLIANSAHVKAAIAQAKGFSNFSGLPDNSMPVLDQAYKNLGGKAAAARAGNDGPLAKNLTDEAFALRDAITGGDPNHPYQQALDAWSGPAHNLDAIEQGKAFLKQTPDELASALENMPDGQKQFFKIGAARALQEKVGSVGDKRNAVAAIYGNPIARQRIDAVFGPTGFGSAMDAENAMQGTGNFVLSGSQTVNKANDPGAMGDFVKDIVKGIPSLVAGEPLGAIGVPAMGLLQRGVGSKLGEWVSGETPQTRAALAKLLMAKGSEAKDILTAPMPSKTARRLAISEALRRFPTAAAVVPGLTTGLMHQGANP